jgi:cytochrome b subunit of formate dehydrogenase
MDRISIRDKIPSIPRPSDSTVTRYSFYSKMISVVLLLSVGVTALISGLVLVPMMAFSGNVVGVVLSAGAISVGGAVTASCYLWLTAPVQ